MAASRISRHTVGCRLSALRWQTGVEEMLQKHGVAPGINVVLVGDDPASAVYVRSKEQAAREAGMVSESVRLPASASQD